MENGLKQCGIGFPHIDRQEACPGLGQMGGVQKDQLAVGVEQTALVEAHRPFEIDGFRFRSKVLQQGPHLIV
ncbi:hypothetical protein [Mesorhizobium sp. 10.2.3]|uniref:hypothetical protein n=1 Tax=Mesorhizobium sp. 10.2.3 TaxID=1085775 RepID=UPI0010A95935|nr:hypothetical protein [Mesorhizobium sp. 10.2.3]